MRHSRYLRCLQTFFLLSRNRSTFETNRSSAFAAPAFLLARWTTCSIFLDLRFSSLEFARGTFTKKEEETVCFEPSTLPKERTEVVPSSPRPRCLGSYLKLVWELFRITLISGHIPREVSFNRLAIYPNRSVRKCKLPSLNIREKWYQKHI